ncbi:MAG: tyrosine-type recombinase/integrase [Candidatus Nitrotoga sp.]
MSDREQLSPEPSFETLLQVYFTDLRVKNWSESTIERRKNSIGRFIQWLLERCIESISEITPEIMEAYQRSLYHIGNLRTGKPIRPSTQASYLGAVSHWMQWACLKKIILFNPAIKIELPKEEYRLPGAFLSEEEAERLLNQADVTTPIGIRDRAILEVLYSSAIRRAELLNLEHYDVDRPRRLLMIRQGKGHKDRVVPVGVRALEWLDKYISDVRPMLAEGKCAKRRIKHWQSEPTNKLILGNWGSAMGKEYLSLLVRQYMVKAGIDKRGSCHMLRHTAATLMMENGADLRSLQTYLGHANLNTTQIYTHVTVDRLRKVHDTTHPAKPDIRPEAEAD